MTKYQYKTERNGFYGRVTRAKLLLCQKYLLLILKGTILWTDTAKWDVLESPNFGVKQIKPCCIFSLEDSAKSPLLIQTATTTGSTSANMLLLAKIPSQPIAFKSILNKLLHHVQVNVSNLLLFFLHLPVLYQAPGGGPLYKLPIYHQKCSSLCPLKLFRPMYVNKLCSCLPVSLSGLCSNSINRCSIHNSISTSELLR